MGVVEYAKNLAASIPQNNGFTMSPALLGAAGSVINGALGFFGQQSANKTNLKIARETNAANRANQEYQNEWNLDMWNKQNEYNSPAAQRQRLEAAGLNPIFNGLDGVSEAGQLQSADYVATPGAPMLNSGEFLGNGIGNAMKTMAEINLLEKQANKVDADTQGQEILNEIQKATQNDVVQGAHYQMLVTKGTVNLTENQSKLVNKQMDYYGKQIDLFEQSIKKIQNDMKLDTFRAGLDAICQFWHLNNEQTKIFNDFFIDLYNCDLSKRRLALDTRVGNAQITLMGAQARVANETADSLNFQNRINQKRAQSGIISHMLTKEKRQLIWDLEFLDDKNINSLQHMDEVLKSIRLGNDKTQQDIDWAPVMNCLQIYGTLMGSFSGIGSSGTSSSSGYTATPW